MITKFDTSRLRIFPIAERNHGLDLTNILPIQYKTCKYERIKTIAKKIITAKHLNASIIFMMGAHVIRAGVQKYLIDLMKRGYVTCIAMNGAGVIHDYEFTHCGATTECVAKYIKEGKFGLWKETGGLNTIINTAYKENKDIGMGEAVGKAISERSFTHKNISLFAAGYTLQIPITVHVGIGYDIIHEHPNCSGEATGALSYNDFLKFVSVVNNLENGIIMNFGSAVTAPEVFLKALSMARNVAHQKGNVIRHFTTLVCDLHDLPDDFSREPSRENAAYFFRPWKTMLVRTVSDGGESYYVKGNHSETIPALWSAINDYENNYF
ncbi:MAG: hypothetical protein MRJ65_12830 [Candidatus Brocadiaceae bacterium]|nr:hypothetical protein [Candidatus Brocadiaceae bacterium]